jgi:polysaccharide export outer membrane protein
MRDRRRATFRPALCALAVVCAGCHGSGKVPNPAEAPPHETDTVTLPDHVIQPPDVLLIDAIKLVPKPPYRIETLDTILVHVRNIPNEPAYSAELQVGADGAINFGDFFGKVRVAGMTIDEARKAIDEHIKLKDPDARDARVEVFEGQTAAKQQVRGEHLVRPDGKVSLGSYGEVRVSGLTLTQAKAAIETQLAAQLADPQVTVDVASYNSSVYYVIFDGGGNGQRVYRLPVTGNETVLDAISRVNGLFPVSSQHAIWVARPAPSSAGEATEGPNDVVLPVDWVGITTRGHSATNYQLLPGDRLFVKADPMVTTDTFIARMLSPIQRVLSITLLGTTTVREAGFNVHSLSGLVPSAVNVNVGAGGVVTRP